MKTAARASLGVAVLLLSITRTASGQTSCVPVLVASDGTFLGNLSANQFDPNSVNNPFGQYGNQFANGIQNQFSPYGSPFSAESATNPYAVQAPRVVDPCSKKYLGQLSANPYAPDSTANKFGQYGSPFSQDSIKNRFGPYGSPYSASSVRNPFAIGATSPQTGQSIISITPLNITPPVGGVDASIYSHAIMPPSPLDSLSQALLLRALQLANQRRELALEQQRRQAQTDAAFLSSMSRPAKAAIPSTPPPVIAQPTPRANALAGAITPSAVTRRTPLPNIEGLRADQVRAFIGAPAWTSSGPRGVTSWYYTTPNGVQRVFLTAAGASLTQPQWIGSKGAASRTSQAAPSARVSSAGACDQHQSANNVRSVTVLANDTPAFVEPVFRQDALTLFPSGTSLSVMGTAGAWFLVEFNDTTWGRRAGYVHCADVTR